MRYFKCFLNKNIVEDLNKIQSIKLILNAYENSKQIFLFSVDGDDVSIENISDEIIEISYEEIGVEIQKLLPVGSQQKFLSDDEEVVMVLKEYTPEYDPIWGSPEE